MNENKKMYIEEIARHATRNNLVLFIGAGFSKALGYPTWNELLVEIIREYNLLDELKKCSLFNREEIEYIEYDNISKLLSGVDYLQLAEYIDTLLNKFEEGIKIQDVVVDIIKEYERNRINNEAYEAITNFFNANKKYINEIITTNYDRNIEFCFDEDISVINRNYNSLNDSDKKWRLYKIHGCINDQDRDIVITESDYQNFISRNRYLFYKIFSLFMEKKIVFIGYSISDPNIRSILNDIREEANDKVKIEFYWIIREKVSNLDIEYYSNKFNIKIIQETDINVFFEDLAIKINEYEQDSNINNNTEKCSARELAISILNDEGYNIYHFLDEFSCLPESQQEKNKKLFQYIIESNKDSLCKIIKYIDSDRRKEKPILKFIKNYNLEDTLINFALDKLTPRHQFGKYKEVIYTCIKIIQYFDQDKTSDIIKCLAENINDCSTSKTIGYDWHGLEAVEEYINDLSPLVVRKLIYQVGHYRESKGNVLYIIRCYDDKKLKQDKNKIIYDLYRKSGIKGKVFRMLQMEMKRNCNTVNRENKNKYIYSDQLHNYSLEVLDENDSLVYKVCRDEEEIFKYKQVYDKDKNKVKFYNEINNTEEPVKEDYSYIYLDILKNELNTIISENII